MITTTRPHPRLRRRTLPRRLLSGAALAAVATLGACVPAPQGEPEAIRPLVFPVAGGASYIDSFGAGRSGGRSHAGQDLMAPKHRPVVAAVDGVVTRVRHDNSGLSGNSLTIRDDEGWSYVYIHLNNDTPGTDDGSNRYELAFADGIRSGQRVRAGEVVGYVGDSGNAENTSPHLHFELHAPDGTIVNAYPSLRAATPKVLSAAETAAAAPFGHLDSITRVAPHTARITGWAIDRKSNAPIDVTIYYDGNPVLTAKAGDLRPDVGAAFPGRGDRHGFSLQVVGIPAGVHRLCAIAHNAGAGGSTRLGCVDGQY